MDKLTKLYRNFLYILRNDGIRGGVQGAERIDKT